MFSSPVFSQFSYLGCGTTWPTRGWWSSRSADTAGSGRVEPSRNSERDSTSGCLCQSKRGLQESSCFTSHRICCWISVHLSVPSSLWAGQMSSSLHLWKDEFFYQAWDWADSQITRPTTPSRIPEESSSPTHPVGRWGLPPDGLTAVCATVLLVSLIYLFTESVCVSSSTEGVGVSSEIISPAQHQTSDRAALLLPGHRTL